jgi:hypothetical protein
MAMDILLYNFLNLINSLSIDIELPVAVSALFYKNGTDEEIIEDDSFIKKTAI